MHLNELLNAVFRTAHLIAGIMWIGNSMLFNWLDRNLEDTGQLSRLSQGRIFMVHSGAFYDVEKKLLEPNQLPATLHWFKWQNGVTWLTGIALLVVVYYLNASSFLIDPSVLDIDPRVAIALSIGSLLAGWLAYDWLWRTVGEHSPGLATGISIALLFGSIVAFARVFSGPAAYMQTGVLIGTVMTGNVWRCILPSQTALIGATLEGRAQDPAVSLRAKRRSIHNNYLTFPLLFTMVSNHFPAATGHRLNWLVLILVMIGGAGVRHFMNARYLGAGRERSAAAWLVPSAAMLLVAVGGLAGITRLAAGPAVSVDREVPFARAQEIIVRRCVTCHSAHPTDDVFQVAPLNVQFDTAEQIQMMAPRIYERAVRSKTMPIVNKTGMEDLERAELGAWIERGARLR